MSFSLTSEQQEFQDMLRGFFRDTFPSEVVRARMNSSEVSSESHWRTLEQLGIAESFASESSTDRAAFPVLLITAFESGRAVVPEGLIEHVLAGPFLSFAICNSDERADILRLGIAEGRASCAWGGTLHFSKADKKGVGEVEGSIPIAPWAALCQRLVAIDPTDNTVLVISTKNAAYTSRELLDRTIKASMVTLSKNPALRLSPTSSQKLIDALRALRAGEIAGCMSRAVEMTSEYVKTREQFGVPIGSFQAVQHRLADMYLHTEAVRALAQFAAWCAESSPEQFSLASSAALHQALHLGPTVVEGAIQLHGGIGFTYEFDLHLLLRRVKCLEAIYRMQSSELQQMISHAAA